MKAKKYLIAVGESVVNAIQNGEHPKQIAKMIHLNNGDIIGWSNNEKLSTLLDMLNGWESYIVVSKTLLNKVQIHLDKLSKNV